MASPITIQIDIAGEAAGTPGQSREEAFAVLGQLVTCTDPANFAGGGTWQWTLVPPVGSSAAASGDTTNTMTFTPDVAGVYLVFLEYDDGTVVRSWTVGSDGDKISSQGGLDIALENGLRLIGVGENIQFGATGWAEKADALNRYAASLGSTESAQGSFIEITKSGAQGSIVGGSPGTKITFDTQGAQRGDIVFDDANDEIDLKAGRTYLLIGSFRITSGNFCTLRFYDETAGSFIGEAANAVHPDGEQSTFHAVINPSVDTSISVRAQNTGFTAGMDGFGVQALAVEIGANPVTQIQGQLWYPPDSPHAWDVEFDSESFPVGWSETWTPSTDLIDVYGNTATTGVPRRQIHSYRRSHYSAQPPSDGAVYYLHRQETLPTNLLVWARLTIQVLGPGAPVNNDAGFGLVMAADDGGGLPDLNNRMTVWINESDTNTLQTEVQRAVGGAVTVVHLGNNLVEMPQPSCYAAIHKIGTDYHFWIGSDAGSWIYAGTYSNAWTMEHIGLVMSNASASGPANKLMHCDFIRFQEQSTRLP